MPEGKTTADPRLPVSEEEVGAATAAMHDPQQVDDHIILKQVVGGALTAAHAVLVPRIERALRRAMLTARNRVPLNDAMADGLAAFWRAMEEGNVERRG